MPTLTELILTKLGYSHEPKMQSKTTELLRLVELRSNNIPAQINEYGKIVLCADIAASLLSVNFEKEEALKLSGLRNSHYAKHKRLFEKLLDINLLVGIKDICIKLGLSGVSQKADELLNLYGKIVAAEDADLDISHPQYAAMAVFQACKMMKQKVVKPKLMAFSNLRPTQWTMLEQRWDKFIAQNYKNKVESNTKKDANTGTSVLQNATESGKSEKTTEKRKKVDDLEDYEHWKVRMLQSAYAKLKDMDTDKIKDVDSS